MTHQLVYLSYHAGVALHSMEHGHEDYCMHTIEGVVILHAERHGLSQHVTSAV